MGFVVAGEQKRLARMTRSERIAALTAQYAELFRCPEALDPTDYLDADCEWPRCGGWRALHCLSLVRTVWGRRPSGVQRSSPSASSPFLSARVRGPVFRGCPTSIMGPGFIAGEGRFWGVRSGRRLGACTWAGTETAVTHWTGYMAGAVEAGERAARRSAAQHSQGGSRGPGPAGAHWPRAAACSGGAAPAAPRPGIGTDGGRAGATGAKTGAGSDRASGGGMRCRCHRSAASSEKRVDCLTDGLPEDVQRRPNLNFYDSICFQSSRTLDEAIHRRLGGKRCRILAAGFVERPTLAC